MRLTRCAAGLLLVSGVALGGCGSSGSSNSAVAKGNAPVKVAFDDPGYPAACQKSMETPNSQGNALTTDQAKTFCGCVQQQAQSQGLSSQSEASITDDQFRALFSTCQSQLTGGGTGTDTTGGTTT